jgi:hypothetical protein
MKLPSKRAVLIGAVVALAAGGAVGGALAASGTFDPKAERQALLNDAAGRLGVTSSKLEDALKQAALDRVNAELAAGQITQAQANAAKAAINAGELPIGIPGAGPGFHRGFGAGRGFGLRGALDVAATYLGLTDQQLRTQLQSGKSLADVAKAQNKSVDGLKQAIIAAVQSKLDQAVKSGRLSRDEESQILAKLKVSIDDLVNGTLPAKPAGAFHDGFRFAPGGFHAPLPAEVPAPVGPSA